MWLATGSPLTAWWETWPLGPRLQWPLAFCAPASLPHGRAVNGSWLSSLVFARVWYFGKHNRCHSVASEPSHRKRPFFFFFSFVSLPFPWFEFSLFSLCYITQPPESLLMVFNTSPFPKDRWGSPHLHTQPPLAVGWHECVSHFSAGNCHSAPFLWWFFLVMLPSEIPTYPILPHLLEGFLLCGNLSSFSTPSPGRSPSWNPFSPFLSLSFVLPHFKEIDLPFWVSGVFHQRSEVVLWKLLHMQKIWCICWGESGQPVLFLHYLGTCLIYFW